MPNPPWKKYRVGKPSTRPNWTETACQPFDEVTHVTHISNALAIIPQGTILPRLIDDESILNTRRLLVNWVSPNHWSPGYRYGNVAFELDWSSIVKGKSLYWVEVMPYNTPACRILVTDNDYDSDSEMTPYDPTAGDGPWWFDVSEKTHYRNGNVCLEFMLEFEISIDACKQIGFVKHHDSGCCIDASSCPDKGMGHQEAAGRFLAGIISERVDTTELIIDDRSVRGGWADWLMNFPQKGFQGPFGVSAKDDAAPALARAVAGAYYRRRKKDFENLGTLFSDRSALESSIRALVEKRFPNLPKE
jgi:hypothetical protein